MLADRLLTQDPDVRVTTYYIHSYIVPAHDVDNEVQLRLEADNFILPGAYPASLETWTRRLNHAIHGWPGQEEKAAENAMQRLSDSLVQHQRAVTHVQVVSPTVEVPGRDGWERCWSGSMCIT